LEIGVTVLPYFPKDSTDRNRTSPFAFTGNKFEFRMLGSAFSIAGPNFVLNTIVAEVLKQFADELEQAKEFKKSLAELVKKTIKVHKRIIFNGNNYSKDWVAEAKQRGLSNLKTTVDALPALVSEKAVELFAAHQVLSDAELHARYEILMEGYNKTIHIEALTMVSLARSAIIPAVVANQNKLAKLLMRKKEINEGFDTTLESQLLGKLSKLGVTLLKTLETLGQAIANSEALEDVFEQGCFTRDNIVPAMAALRQVVDELETIVAQKYWPLPSYAQILNSVV